MQYESPYSHLLESLPFWSDLTEEEQALVVSRQTILHYQIGQHVCGTRTDCLGLLLVAKGALRTYLLSPDGREVTLYRTREGEACVMAAACALHALSFETQVEAETDCEILLVPIDVYSALLKNNIHVECDSYKIATERFADVVAGLERLVFLSLEQRLAAFLLDEAAERGSDMIYLTHEQIAVNIGSAREAVGRTLKNMASHDLVELFRGGVRLRDRAALYRLIA